MFSYPGSHWSLGESMSSQADLGISAGAETLRSVARAAATASETDVCLIYRKVDGVFELIEWSGVGVCPPVTIGYDPGEAAILIATRGDSGLCSLWLESDCGFRFAAAVFVGHDDDCKGLLVVADFTNRDPLSPAQHYVLQAHAAHLATLLALGGLQQDRSALVAEQNSRSERLRLLESVVVHARDSIIITEAEPIDLPGPRILYCNTAFERTTGYRAEEVIGKTPRILQGRESSEIARAKLREALANWSPVEVELVNYRKDGSKFWVELSIVPVADETGWFTHWVSVQRDITERKEAEDLAIRMRVAELENEALADEIRERKRVEAELLYTAFHDNLTHLRNRAFFMTRLEAICDAARPTPESGCAVLFLDLDRFKVVNDSIGHAAGDVLLKEVARRLRQCVRPQDVLARFGGDEFAILVVDTAGLAVAVTIAERVMDALRDPIAVGGQTIFASCSIGIAHSSCSGEGHEGMIRDADIAMYSAKRSGFGDYAVFAPGMRDEAASILALQTDLRVALEQQQFRLEYQPIVRPADSHIEGFEALLRWDHPARGLLLPDAFVAVAEDIGLIREIDRWVMREALSQLSSWQNITGDTALRMSINTSAVEFTDADFVAELKAVLTDHRISGHCLELEITEGMFLHPTPRITTIIEQIRNLGIRIALDDFGTGYSALSYINQYPIDTIKIDKSFVSGMCRHSRTMAVVEAIVHLGRALDLNIVAEGVETAQQAAILNKMACSHAQGFLFSPSVSADAALAMIGGRTRASR